MAFNIFGSTRRKKSQKASLSKQIRRLKAKEVVHAMKKEVARLKNKLGEI